MQFHELLTRNNASQRTMKLYLQSEENAFLYLSVTLPLNEYSNSPITASHRNIQ